MLVERLGGEVFRHKPKGKDQEFYAVSGLDHYGSLGVPVVTYSDGRSSLLSPVHREDRQASERESEKYWKDLEVARKKSKG